MKVLFVANVPGHLAMFHYPYMKWFKENGSEVFVATIKAPKLNYCDEQIGISFSRNPFHPSNFKAYFQIKNLLKCENFDIVHCNNSIPSFLTILAARHSKIKTKVLYTAHGYYFYHGCPLKNWLLYPISKYSSTRADCLVTINNEDFLLAKDLMGAEHAYKINGVGYKNKFLEDRDNSTEDKKNCRRKIGLVDEDATIFLSVGELNNNKNHKLAIEALSYLGEENYKYFIAGCGNNFDELNKYIKEKKLKEKVFLLGYRDDIPTLMKAADVFLFPSRREGLPVSLMEAMASELPCIVSNIRGNNDLIDKKGGFLFENNNLNSLVSAIRKAKDEREKWPQMGKYNREKSLDYSLKRVFPEMIKVYKSMM